MIVKCNIDKISYTSKPVSEYGAIRNRLGTNATRTLDAQRLFRGILKGHTFTPAAMSGKGGDSWQEQRLFAVDIVGSLVLGSISREFHSTGVHGSCRKRNG